MDARLLLQGIMRDTIRRITVTKLVGAGVWYRMPHLLIELHDGQKVECRFAYCARAHGIIHCNAPRQTTKPTIRYGHFDTKTFTPELLAELKKLPLRKPPTKKKAA